MEQLRRWLDTASTEAVEAGGILASWIDSAEVSVQMGRTLLTRSALPDSFEQRRRQFVAVQPLLFRGHLIEVFQKVGTSYQGILTPLALYGGAPVESVTAVFNDPKGPPMMSAMPWWASQKDAARLGVLIRRLDSASRSAPSASQRRRNHWDAERARAYLFLARGDTTLAISKFFAVIDSICWTCSYSRHVTDIHALAPLLWARGRDREAEPYLDFYNPTVDVPVLEIALTLQAARVAERLGNREKAIAKYRRFARAWADADPRLQPMVEEAKAALRRLGAGGVWEDR
jgi:hypothetical protein